MKRKINRLFTDVPALVMFLVLLGVIVGAGTVGLWIHANYR